MASTMEYDYIIAGGGTAGCALASRLKQGNPDLSIVLLERGKDEASDPLVLNPLAVTQLVSAGISQIYASTTQRNLLNRRIGLHAGNVLSGSSAVNYGLWMRGDRKDYDQWSKIVADERWSYDGLLPFFRRTESHFDPDTDQTQHGLDGPFKLAAGREYPLRKPFLDAFLEIGLKENPDANAGDPLGIGKYTENWSPVRQPSSLAYDLSGIEIVTSSLIKRIVLESNAANDTQATGVELTDGRIFRAKREVILSCGAYRTPQVLMLSGIGPAEQLSKLGIEPRLVNEHVGANLWDHLACFLCYKLEPEAAQKGLAVGNAVFMSNPKHFGGTTVDWSVLDTLPEAELRANLTLDGQMSAEKLALLNQRAHHWIAPVYMPISLGDDYDIGMDGEHISIGTLNFQPTSRGTITLQSSDPAVVPDIDPNYIATHHDRYVLREATRKCLKVAETSALKDYLIGEAPPTGKAPLTTASSDEEIDARVAHCSTTLQHGAGTAAMGTVVDSFLKLKGVGGLRICDASVFPAPISATPQATVYAVAESLADLILRGQ